VTPGNCPKQNILHTVQGENFKSRIYHIYVEETTTHFRLFGKLRIKKIKFLTSLKFLLRCRDHNTTPRLLQFHHRIHSRAAIRIDQRTSLALLREWIHQNRRELDSTSRELLNTHLRIANLHSESDGALIDKQL